MKGGRAESVSRGSFRSRVGYTANDAARNAPAAAKTRARLLDR